MTRTRALALLLAGVAFFALGVEGGSANAQASVDSQAPAVASGAGDAGKPATESTGMLKIRDPFRRPGLKYSAVPRTPLELYSLDQLKLVGVMTGPDQMRAIIEAPDGKTHFATQGSKIGTRDGIIARITGNGILVKEKFVNVLGQEELHDYPMLLPSEKGDDGSGSQEKAQ